jgi:Amt family ammonium transporter
MALVASPQWLDTGDNAWQLAAATFVGLQSIPGLTVLYGGIVKKKWAINSAFMSMYAFASVLVVWVLFDYNHGVRAAVVSILGHAGSRDIGASSPPGKRPFRRPRAACRRSPFRWRR